MGRPRTPDTLPPDTPDSPHASSRSWGDQIAIVALLAALLWLYSAPLFLHYYSYDEGNLLLGRPIPLYAALFMLVQYGLFNGRPLSYFIWGIFLSFASTGSSLQGLRLLNFVAGCVVAVGLFTLLRQRRLGTLGAAALVLFVYSQPVLQIYFAVSLRFTYWLGIAASLLAFVVIDRSPTFLPDRRRVLAAGALLAIGWTTFQATPFIVLAPMAFAIARADASQWPAERGRYASLLGLLLVSTAVYIAAYGLLLQLTGARQYWLTERFFGTVADPAAIATSGALHLGSYLGPFEWWNYIEPVARLADGTWMRWATASAAFWLAWIVAAGVSDWHRGGGRFASEKYGLLLVSVGVTFLPLAADGFTLRQNVYIACVPTVAFTLVGAATVVLRRMPRLRLALLPLVLGLVATVALGAKAGFRRALIDPSLSHLATVAAQIRDHTGPPPERIVVVVVPHECREEPCRGVHGYRASLGNRRDLGDFYAALAAQAGMPAGLPVEFTDAAGLQRQTTAAALVIDLRRRNAL